MELDIESEEDELDSTLLRKDAGSLLNGQIQVRRCIVNTIGEDEHHGGSPRRSGFRHLDGRIQNLGQIRPVLPSVTGKIFRGESVVSTGVEEVDHRRSSTTISEASLPREGTSGP